MKQELDINSCKECIFNIPRNLLQGLDMTCRLNDFLKESKQFKPSKKGIHNKCSLYGTELIIQLEDKDEIEINLGNGLIMKY